MAIAYDNSTSGYVAPGSSTVTISHTITGSDTILFTGIHNQNASGFSTLTYNGVSFSSNLLKNRLTTVEIALYYIYASAGTANLVVTRAATGGYMMVMGASYSGVNQSMTWTGGSPSDATNSGNGSGTSFNATVTSVTDNSWAIAMAEFDNAGISAGAGSTQRKSLIPGYLAWGIYDPNAAKTPAGSISMTINGTSGGYQYCIATFSPAASGTNVTVNATVQVATLSIPTSTVTAIRNTTISSTVLSSTFSIPTATATATRSVDVTATVQIATFSIPSATATATQSATVSSSVLSATFSIPTSTVTATRSVDVSASVLSATFSIPTVSVITPDAYITPSALSATFSIPTPTISVSTNVSITATVLSATFLLQASTVTAIMNVSIAGSVQTATFSIPTATPSVGVSISSTVLTATFSAPSRTVTAEKNGLAEPSALTATISTQSPTITAQRYVTITSSVVSAIFSIQTPRKVGGLWVAQARVQGDWTPEPRSNSGVWTPQARAN